MTKTESIVPPPRAKVPDLGVSQHSPTIAPLANPAGNMPAQSSIGSLSRLQKAPVPMARVLALHGLVTSKIAALKPPAPKSSPLYRQLELAKGYLDIGDTESAQATLGSILVTLG